MLVELVPATLLAPLPRDAAMDWWKMETLADLDHVPGMGYHSFRRKFANDLNPTTNLRDLAYMGGWKSPVTLLTVYQQPDLELQREALARVDGLKRSVSQKPTDT